MLDIVELTKHVGAKSYPQAPSSFPILHCFTEDQLAAYSRVLIDACANEVPASWLDPLLTGKNAAFDRLPVPGPNLEALLRAVKLRILGLLPAPKEQEKKA